MVTNSVRIAVSITFAVYSLVTIALGIWATKREKQAKETGTFYQIRVFATVGDSCGKW